MFTPLKHFVSDVSRAIRPRRVVSLKHEHQIISIEKQFYRTSEARKIFCKRYHRVLVPCSFKPDCGVYSNGVLSNRLAHSMTLTEDLVSRDVIEKDDVGSIQLIDSLVEIKVQRNIINRLFTKAFPLCKTVAPTKWQTAFVTLRDYGIQDFQIYALVKRNPKIFHVSPHKIHETMSGLRQLYFRENAVKNLCLSNPRIVTTDIQHIANQFEHLKEYFAKHEIFPLIKENPKILSDDWSKTESKILYLVEDMGLPVKSILGTNVLRCPLEHTKYRHLLLLRTGVYETPGKKGTTIPNPSLLSIVNTRDKYFSVKVAQVSIEEYNTFMKLMEKYEEYESEIFDSDAESDSDDHDQSI